MLIMIRKIEENVLRVYKECQPYLLIIYFQEKEEKMRLKVVDHPIANRQVGNYMQTQIRQFYYFKDFVYSEMPDLIRYNFQSLKQVFEEIRMTNRGNFTFQGNLGLKIGLQVGTKIKFCVFQLQVAEYTSLQRIQALLWQSECESERQQAQNLLQSHQIKQMKAIIQRHNQEIALLHAMIKTEKEERLKAQQRLQSITTQLQAEIHQMRMNEVLSRYESESIAIQGDNRAQISSLICEEKMAIQAVQFINLEQQINWLKNIEQYNGGIDLNRFKFKLDANSGSDLDHAYTRNRQTITYRKRDQRHRQFTSLMPLPQPIGMVNFRLHHSKENNIYVGVILACRVKMPSTTRDGDAITYKLSGSGLWEDKVRAQVSIEKIYPSQVLTLIINFRRKAAQWWKRGRLIVERALPSSFQEQSAFPFINMIHQGDCVEFA